MNLQIRVQVPKKIDPDTKETVQFDVDVQLITDPRIVRAVMATIINEEEAIIEEEEDRRYQAADQAILDGEEVSDE